MAETKPTVVLPDLSRGYWFTAALTERTPSMTSTEGRFTDAWPVGWDALGVDLPVSMEVDREGATLVFSEPDLVRMARHGLHALPRYPVGVFFGYFRIGWESDDHCTRLTANCARVEDVQTVRTVSTDYREYRIRLTSGPSSNHPPEWFRIWTSPPSRPGPLGWLPRAHREGRNA